MNKIEASRQLKTCPFCGSKVYIFTAPNGFYGVECDKLGCVIMQATYERSLEKLVRDWNNRVSETKIRNQAISDFLSKICEKYTQEERKGNYKQYCASIKQDIADIAAEMRGAE